MQTCRFCGESVFDGSLIHYGRRHNAHGRCLIEAKGEEVFNILKPAQLKKLPYFALRDAGLLEKMEAVAKSA